MGKNAKYLAGLDGLRFISISFVVLHHLFTFKSNFGFEKFDLPVLGLIGYYGIQFFFTGSGFLITYLLLLERSEYGRVSLPQFFIRRILRIWPGYYLLVSLALLAFLKHSFFHIPGLSDTYLETDYEKSNLFYFIFLPHLQPFFYPTAPLVHQTYTIGIEEQFYIIWGFLFFFLHRWLWHIFIFIVFGSLSLSLLHNYLHQFTLSNAGSYPVLQFFKSAITYLRYSRFSTLAIGSLFGYAYFLQHKWIYYLKTPIIQLLLYALIIVSIKVDISPFFGRDEWISFLMACLMLSATFDNHSLISFNSKWLSALGKISYGIYLFHMIAIVGAIRLTRYVFPSHQNVWVYIVLGSLTMALSILFGWISYYGFERHFLKFKRLFQRVKVPCSK